MLLDGIISREASMLTSNQMPMFRFATLVTLHGLLEGVRDFLDWPIAPMQRDALQLAAVRVTSISVELDSTLILV